MTNLWIWLALAVAGGVGAGLRYLVDVGVRGRWGAPWGILVVNVTGSFALGLLAGFGSPWVAVVIGAGLLGGYTTFSTVSVDSASFARDRRWRASLMNLLGTLVLAGAAAAGGLALGALVRG